MVGGSGVGSVQIVRDMRRLIGCAERLDLFGFHVGDVGGVLRAVIDTEVLEDGGEDGCIGGDDELAIEDMP